MKSVLHSINGSTRLLVDGRPFTVLGGELHNSSASSLAYLEPLLDRLVRCRLNTVLAPVSWELLEPREGEFDFALIDGMIRACRERGLKLVPLWFGAMKNAISCYTPEWVKTDLRRFPRAETTPGTPSWTVSPFCREILTCDARAFARLMARIREVDGEAQTVILVQVENESGILNAPRDYSPLAQAAFAQPVPDRLLAYLNAHHRELHPELRAIRERSGARDSGDWSTLFGADADEIFMAWQIASFIETVAAAGRAEYDLPLFANAWLCGGPGFPPGKYPSGGPIPKMFDIWHAAAPHLDFLAPDIYTPKFRDACADFAVPGNLLFVPEARNSAIAAANALYVIGRHQALGFSPFAIDDIAEDHPLVETYAQLHELLLFLQRQAPMAAMTGFVQEAAEERWEVALGGFRFAGRTNLPLEKLTVPGSALLAHLGGSEFLCLGRSLTFTFTGASGRPAELVALDTGSISEGTWQPGRRLNGDETAHGTGVLLGEKLQLCRFRLFDPAPGEAAT
jgi:beta-galactosidase GanA